MTAQLVGGVYTWGVGRAGRKSAVSGGQQASDGWHPAAPKEGDT